jgi:hypothetical protein
VDFEVRLPSKLAARDLTCIKSYPLDDAMVTRLIKLMAVTEREPETAITEPK